MICSDDTTTGPSRWEARGGFDQSPQRETISLHQVAFRKRLEDFEVRLASSVRQFQQLSKSFVSGKNSGTNSIAGGVLEPREPRYEEQQVQRMRQLGAAQTITRKLIILSRQRPTEVNNAFIEGELTKCAPWVCEEFKTMVTADMEQCRMLIEDTKNSVGDFVTQQSRTKHGLVSRDSFANTGESRLIRSEAEQRSVAIKHDQASHSNQEVDGFMSRADCETAFLRVKKIKRSVGFERVSSGIGKKPQHSKTTSSGIGGLVSSSPFTKQESALPPEAIVRIKNKFVLEQEKDQPTGVLLTSTNNKPDDQVASKNKASVFSIKDRVATDYQIDEPLQSVRSKAVVSPLNGSQLYTPIKGISANLLNEDSNFTGLKFWPRSGTLQNLQYELCKEDKIASRKHFLTWLDAVNEADLMREFIAPPGQSSRYLHEGITPVNQVAVKRQMPKLSPKLTLAKPAAATSPENIAVAPSPRIAKIPSLKLPSSAVGTSMNASTSQINISVGGTKHQPPKAPKLVLSKQKERRKPRLDIFGVVDHRRGGSCPANVGWSGNLLAEDIQEAETAARKTGDENAGEVIILKLTDVDSLHKQQHRYCRSLSNSRKPWKSTADKKITIFELFARSHQKYQYAS